MAASQMPAAVPTDDDPPTSPIAAALSSRFEPIRPLAPGSQKRIELAWDRTRRREVVLSRIAGPSGTAGRERMSRELHARERLAAHPQIVPVDEVIETPHELLLISPHLAGGDLQTLLAAQPDRRLPIPRALSIARAIARAITHCHRSGVIHGDVKPANVLLDGDGHAHLGDFGLARIGDDAPTDELAGTPAYLPPEQIQGGPASEAGDLYSLGCVLYEMLAGVPPFEGETLADLLRLHQHAHATNLRRRLGSVPLPLGMLVERLLEKDPALRPGSAWDVAGALWGMLRALNAEAADALDEDDTSDLVGRSDELARMERIAEQVDRGRPRLVFVSGEAGVGKTRFVRTLMQRQDLQGRLVLYGAASPDRPLPYGPIVDALVQLSGHVSLFEGGTAASLRRFLYLNFDETPPPDADERRAIHDRDYDRLYALLLEGLKRLSDRHPIVLVLDELQHGDSATLELLRQLEYTLASRIPDDPLRVMIVGSYRTPEVPRALQDLVSTVERTAEDGHLALSAFSEPGSHAFLHAAGIERPTRRLIEEAHRTSQGNPLLLKELVRELRSADALVDLGGRISTRRPIADLGLPSTLRDRVDAWASSLSPQTITVLSLFALVGPELEPEAFSAPLREAGWDSEVAVEEAVSAKLLVRVGEQVRFAHPLIREGFASRLAPEERHVLHERIARAWLELPDVDPRVLEIEVATHLIAAGPRAGDWPVAAWAERAGEQALGRYAWAEAARFLEAALAQTPDPEGRGRLHHTIGRAHMQLMDAEPCLRHFQQAADLLDTPKTRAGHAEVVSEYTRATVWFGVRPSDDTSAGPEVLRRAIEGLAPSQTRLRARLLIGLSEYELTYGDLDRAAAHARASLASSDRESDPRTMAEAGILLGFTAFRALDLEGAHAIWRTALRDAERAKDPFCIVRCLNRLAMASFCAGHVEDMRESCERLARMSRVLPFPGEAAIHHSLEAALALVQGDVDGAHARVDEALRIVRRARHPWAMIYCGGVLACLNALRGDATSARRAADLMIGGDFGYDPRAATAMTDVYRLLIEWYVGNPATDVDVARSRLVEDLRRGGSDSRLLLPACIAVEIAEATQDPALAAEALPCLEHAAERGWILTLGWPFFVPRVLGAAATLVGDYERAAASFERGLEWARGLDMPSVEGRTRLDLAQMLATRNAPGDRDRAAEMAVSARDRLDLPPSGTFFRRAEKLVGYLTRED